MRRLERMDESVLGLTGSSVDSNKFYSILLDARAANITENMYDIAEKLLISEKDNAKLALDQLWTLKKNVINNDTSGTVDMLIEYYQEKMDVLRFKEEHLKKISKDSRSLLEQKQKSDEEIASVKTQITDCEKSISELNEKLKTLKVREQELLLIEGQLKKELTGNENEIVNGLYEIIIHQNENKDDSVERKENHTAEQQQAAEDVLSVEESATKEEQDHQDCIEEGKKPDEPEIIVFPKSVVKTTGGTVIGEYYYDGQVYKNERHYIFSSKFFSEQLNSYLKFIKNRFDQTMYTELLQMIQDASKRVAQNSNIHFEISTNEIVNEKTIKELLLDVKSRSFDKAQWFGSKLKSKIEMLNVNYNTMLQEQILRCRKKD